VHSLRFHLQTRRKPSYNPDIESDISEKPALLRKSQRENDEGLGLGDCRITEKPRDPCPDFVAVREYCHVLAALDSMELRPGYPCGKRLTMLFEG
jgi:hypothetical protein